MGREIDPHEAVDFILKNAGKFSKAKAERVYIENFMRSKKALLMKESPESSGIGQERDAYAHPEYIALGDGLKEAVEVEEALRWALVAAQLRVDIWRSQEASNRATDRSTS